MKKHKSVYFAITVALLAASSCQPSPTGARNPAQNFVVTENVNSIKNSEPGFRIQDYPTNTRFRLSTGLTSPAPIVNGYPFESFNYNSTSGFSKYRMPTAESADLEVVRRTGPFPKEIDITFSGFLINPNTGEPYATKALITTNSGNFYVNHYIDPNNPFAGWATYHHFRLSNVRLVSTDGKAFKLDPRFYEGITSADRLYGDAFYSLRFVDNAVEGYLEYSLQLTGNTISFPDNTSWVKDVSLTLDNINHTVSGSISFDGIGPIKEVYQKSNIAYEYTGPFTANIDFKASIPFVVFSPTPTSTPTVPTPSPSPTPITSPTPIATPTPSPSASPSTSPPPGGGGGEPGDDCPTSRIVLPVEINDVESTSQNLASTLVSNKLPLSLSSMEKNYQQIDSFNKKILDEQQSSNPNQKLIDRLNTEINQSHQLINQSQIQIESQINFVDAQRAHLRNELNSVAADSGFSKNGYADAIVMPQTQTLGIYKDIIQDLENGFESLIVYDRSYYLMRAVDIIAAEQEVYSNLAHDILIGKFPYTSPLPYTDTIFEQLPELTTPQEVLVYLEKNISSHAHMLGLSSQKLQQSFNDDIKIIDTSLGEIESAISDWENEYSQILLTVNEFTVSSFLQNSGFRIQIKFDPGDINDKIQGGFARANEAYAGQIRAQLSRSESGLRSVQSKLSQVNARIDVLKANQKLTTAEKAELKSLYDQKSQLTKQEAKLDSAKSQAQKNLDQTVKTSAEIDAARGVCSKGCVKPGEFRKPIPNQSGKEGSKGKPSWVTEGPWVGESGNMFAKRMCDAKYDPGKYPKGPGTEYNQIRKWADDHFYP